MTREEKLELINHLKYEHSIGADYTISDKEVDEILKALEKQDTFDTSHNDNICNSCIHKSVCKFNTVCRVDAGDTCSAYEPASICHLCSKANSCEVKTYPISKCKQHYYSQKPRLNKIREEINNISGKIIIEDYVEYGSNCPKYVPLEEVLRIIDKWESEEVL